MEEVVGGLWHKLITRAASELGCSVGALDAAIWNYMSSKDPRGATDA